MANYKIEDFTDAALLYENPLSCNEDVKDFVLEGKANITFPEGRMRIENAVSDKEGQKANYVFWCPEEFPSDVLIQWNFWPLREPGLCMLFFAAKGKNGEDLFDPSLANRTAHCGGRAKRQRKG